MNFSALTATAFAAALVAATAVLGFSYAPGLFVWAAFIGWASYDHSGATAQAALRSSAALIFGVVMAWIVAVVVTAHILPLAPTIATAIVAGIASFLIVMASRWPLLGVVPATFYGFASTFAWLSLAPNAFNFEALTETSARNVLVALPASLLIGTGLGILHGRLQKILSRDAGDTSRQMLRRESPAGGGPAALMPDRN